MMGITVKTTEDSWWYHYEYRGLNIDVEFPKDLCCMESADAQATWLIHDTIESLDIKADEA